MKSPKSGNVILSHVFMLPNSWHWKRMGVKNSCWGQYRVTSIPAGWIVPHRSPCKALGEQPPARGPYGRECPCRWGMWCSVISNQCPQGSVVRICICIAFSLSPRTCGTPGASLEYVLWFPKGFVCSKTSCDGSQSMVSKDSWEMDFKMLSWWNLNY